MKFVKDERLMLQGLKNIRIAFTFQSLGLLFLIFYQYVIQGMNYSEISDLLILFTSTATILGFLNLRVSIDVYEGEKTVKPKFFLKVILIPMIVGIAFMGIYIVATPNASIKEAGILGLVFFVCFLIPALISYYIRKKRVEELEE